MDKRFVAIDEHFADVDKRFVAIDEHFAEQRQYIEYGLDRLGTELRAEMSAGFQRMARHIDETLGRFIDMQGGINRDHDSRIRALERARRRKA